MHKAEKQEARERLTAAERYRTEAALIEAAETAAAITNTIPPETWEKLQELYRQVYYIYDLTFEVMGADKNNAAEALDKLKEAKKIFEELQRATPADFWNGFDYITKAEKHLRELTDDYKGVKTTGYFSLAASKTNKVLDDTEIMGVKIGKKRKKLIVTHISIDDISELSETQINVAKAISNAAGRLYDKGITEITAQSLLEEMTGKRTRTPETLEELERLCAKMAITRVIIAVSDEEKAAYKATRNINPTYWLPCEIYITWNKNKVDKVFRLKERPPFYAYASDKKQLFTCKKDGIDLKPSLEDVALFEFLGEEVHRCKGGKSPCITCEKLYKSVGAETERQRRTARNKAEKILGGLSRQGTVKSYKAYKIGAKIQGYKVKY